MNGLPQILEMIQGQVWFCRINIFLNLLRQILKIKQSKARFCRVASFFKIFSVIFWMLGRTRPDFVWLTSFLMILKSQCNKHLWMEWLGVAIMFDGLLMVFGTPSYLLVFDGCSSSVKWCDGQRPSLKSYFLECKKDAINVMIQQRVSTLWRVTWKLI